MSRRSASPGERPGRRRGRAGTGATTILIVEDDESVACTLGAVLQAEGYAVELAASVPEALAQLELGLLRERGGVAAEALQTLGVDLARAQEQFEARAQARSSDAGAPIGFSLAALAAIERAGWDADQRGHRPAGTGHLLLGLLSVPEGHAAPLLEQLGIGAEGIRGVIEPLLAREEA